MLLARLGLTAGGLVRRMGWSLRSPGLPGAEQEAKLLGSLAGIWTAAVQQKVVDSAGPVTQQVLVAVLQWHGSTVKYQRAFVAAAAATGPTAGARAGQQGAAQKQEPGGAACAGWHLNVAQQTQQQQQQRRQQQQQQQRRPVPPQWQQ